MHLQHTIVAKFRNHQMVYISIHDIQRAIQHQYHASIDVKDISTCGPDLLIHMHQSTTYSLMLASGSLDMIPISLSLMPWNAEYGSTIVPAHTQLADSFNFDYSKIARNMRKPAKQALILIDAIPAHLCSDTTIKTLLQKLCDVPDITFDRPNHTYQVSAKTHCIENIPSVAHLGLKKIEAGQAFIYIWPIWLEAIDFTSEDSLILQSWAEEEAAKLGIFVYHTVSIV